MDTRSVVPELLSSDDRAAWHHILETTPALKNPYLTPEWCDLVSSVRSDVRIVIFRKHGKAVGFLPVQQTKPCTALPVGGPICDYQALIASADTTIDIRHALNALGVKCIDFTAFIPANANTYPPLKSRNDGMVANLSNGWQGYEENRREAGSSVLKRVRKKYRKMKSECGEVVFTPFAHDEQAFEQLLNWKREQWRRTGSVDVISKSWINRIIHNAYSRSTENFGGELFTLKADGNLAAAVFCLRYKKVLHAWFAGYCQEYERFSPGIILFTEMMKTMADKGYEQLDFGGGDYRFKQSLATGIREAGPGFVGSSNLASLSRLLQYSVRDIAERLPLGRASEWPAKAMRRFDVIRGMADERQA